MAELFHECGIAAVYHLPQSPVSPSDDASPEPVSPLIPSGKIEDTSRLMVQMLLDIQNRGQLAAGITRFHPEEDRLLSTHKDVGTVTEVFHLNQPERSRELMNKHLGRAAIGHTRYATCGLDDRSNAQPFEREHIEKPKWFSFAFNGQLANYPQLRDEILADPNFHLARDTDTEIIMHMIAREFSEDRDISLVDVLKSISHRLDGAYNIVFLSADGRMFVARDPLGMRPLCYAVEGQMFAAASESVALAHLGFKEENIHSLEPGQAVIIENGELSIRRFAESPRKAHCFFEWIYFANVASTLDDRSVYVTRKRLGEELAKQETIQCDRDTIVVPVPDTAKAAADSMAYCLDLPSLEGLIRNRYVGRTFIDGANRADKVRMKYTPLKEVLEGKRVLLVEDTIVRSTTMKALVRQLKERGHAKEVHVRVACPPIISPCFYGIDMSTIGELFAPKFMDDMELTPEIEAEMAETIGADSLRYLPVSAIKRSIGIEESDLCQACVDCRYPTDAGQQLYQIALNQREQGSPENGRTYDASPADVACVPSTSNL